MLLLNVTWWSFITGRNQEQLDAFGAFAAEGTAQIEVITVAWLMSIEIDRGTLGNHGFNSLLQVLQVPQVLQGTSYRSYILGR